jgi:large subunit ribosomal protein L30
MGKVKITQIRSAIDRPERQKKTLRALGLKKLHAAVEHDATPQILGMIQKVQHLVSVQTISEEK